MAGITHDLDSPPNFPSHSQPSTFIRRLLPRQRRAWLSRLEASALALATMWLFIAAVSALDVYCSIKYEYELGAEEMNPIGRWLMALDGGSVGLFMACKFLGNLLALGVLQALYFLHRPMCLLVAVVLTAAQGILALLLLA